MAALMFFFLTTTTYQPTTKDTEINKEYPTTNYGSQTTLTIYQNSQQTIWKRFLLHFDISDIPNNATFSQGDLSLYWYSGALNKSYWYLYRLTTINWTELGATWNKYDGTNDWTTAGGDWTTTNGSSGNYDYLDFPCWKTISNIALIQDCYDNQSKNIHLIMKNIEDGYNRSASCYSRDYTDDTSLRPKLTVTYTAVAAFIPRITMF
ncbi:MAG: DNRLRE domain-containing protein [Candidatus Heimdallarchaeaceae archaeon]